MKGPVRQIPTAVTKVDLKTGKETHEAGVWNIIPPAADRCQYCGAKHEPELPHNAQSLYYQTIFNSMLGRGATWADAMAHCSPEMQKAWEAALRAKGVWTEPPNGEKPVAHHGG